MSEQVYQPDHKPLFNETVLTYFGVVGAVAIAIAVFFGAIAASTPGEAEGVTETLKKLRVAKREEVNGAGRKLISEYGKNANGTFRIPADEAAKILVNNPAALDAARGVSK
jgi:hypothetical protein